MITTSLPVNTGDLIFLEVGGASQFLEELAKQLQWADQVENHCLGGSKTELSETDGDHLFLDAVLTDPNVTQRARAKIRGWKCDE